MMTKACERLSHPKRHLLALGIPAALVALYCMGFAMQVAGWILVQRNGGNAGPFPQFFPQHLGPLMWVWLSIIPAALVFILQAHRAKTTGDAKDNLNANKSTGGDVQ
jgi:hypothetical protein